MPIADPPRSRRILMTWLSASGTDRQEFE